MDTTDLLETKAMIGTPGALTDHEGKRSNIRLVSAGSFLVAAALALAPLFGRPESSMELIGIFLLGGPGLKVWQAVGGGDSK